jgi:hypothetical protein
MKSKDNLPSTNSPLINYTLLGLEKCWLPQFSRWSHIYHLDGRDQPNESVPHSDVFYTLNVLLGLARVKNVPCKIDIRKIFKRNVTLFVTLPVTNYAFGMALWAAAELRLEMPGVVLDEVKKILFNRNNWLEFRAQDLGMLLTGVVAQAKLESHPWSQLATDLFDFLTEHFCCSSGLFFDVASGLRRPFGSFATQTYLTLACYAYGEHVNNERAIAIANSCTNALIARQGPNGEWPWYYEVPSGLIVDFYEVYSVHQYGMAPAFLERAEFHGVKDARHALLRGFEWALGKNQLGKCMLVPDLNLTIRSQVRKGELHTKQWRALRSIRAAFLHRGSGLADPERLQLRLECRSYELGWILWSFGQRTDLPQLTKHRLFAGALPQQKLL